LFSLDSLRNLAKAPFRKLLSPSVKTDGNESKKRLFIAALLRDGWEKEHYAALAKISPLAIFELRQI
jgi:hypothetical protein